MSDDRGTLQAIAYHLSVAFQPLEQGFRDVDSFKVLMRRLGWDVQALPASYVAIADATVALIDAVDALPDQPGIAESIDLIQQTGNLYQAIKSLPDKPPGIDPSISSAEIARRLTDLLLGEYLRRELPVLHSALTATGVIRYEYHEAQGTEPAFTRYRFDFEAIPRPLTDPLSIPHEVYGWGTPDFEFDRVAEVLVSLFDAFRLPAAFERVAPQTSRLYQASASGPPEEDVRLAVVVALFEAALPNGVADVGFTIAELPAEGSALPGLIVQPDVPSSIALSIPFTSDLTFDIRAGTDLAQTFGVVLRPDDVSVRYPFAPGTTLPSAGFSATLKFKPADKAILLGEAGKTRLDLAAAHVGVAVEYVSGELELRLDAAVEDLSIVINTSDVDGFLKELFGGTDLIVPVQFGAAWSNRRGFTFIGGLGIQVSVAPHLSLGPISIDRLDLSAAAAFGSSGPPALATSAAVALSGELGPLAFSTEGIGVELRFVFQEGNAGPFDIAFGFKPPTALGLVIDAGPVTGGGFLSFDHPRGRYAGILQLAISDIAISAIGLLDTKTEAGDDLPPPGFSFLIIISVEFTPIQLGYGFTLNGVGGLAGIHRTVVTAALQAGLRAGTLDHILFPQDPVRNAPQIISDLRAVFPVAVGRYVFGPMAKLGWGTPSIITAELGIILELPSPFRIVILGQAAVILPEGAPIVQIRLDVLGIIDFEQQSFSIDASIRDSFVAAFALSGDMAMRLNWGNRPNFALSVGGLNPNFTPPPNFPSLRRIQVSLGLGDNPRISLQGYMAVTSNSLQFGAEAELYAEAAGFNVSGQLGFDALIIFQPFYFRVDYRAGFALRKGSRRIAGISIKGMLTGPSPFYVRGEGSISLFFFDITIPFEATFGERREVVLPAKSPLAELEAALADVRNWTSTLPASVFAGVSRTAPADAPTLLLHDPMGLTSFRQKVIPLNKTLERFGEFAITGADRFDVAGVRVGDNFVPSPPLVRDFMAPGLSENLTDREKVTRDSYELEVVGVEVGGARAEFGPGRTKALRYEQRIVETPWRARVVKDLFEFTRSALLALTAVGAKGRSTVSRSGRRKFAAPAGKDRGVRVAEETWLVVDAETLQPAAGFGAGVTKGQAYRAYKTHVARHPRDRSRLEVVSSFETRGAA